MPDASSGDRWPEWHLVFAVLSMERAEPFLQVLGLRAEDGPQLRAVARKFLEEVGPLFKRTWEETDARIGAAKRVSDEPWTNYRKAEAAAAGRAVATIRKSIGAEAAGAVEELAGEFDFMVNDRAEWQWATLFEVLLRKKATDLGEELSWPSTRVADLRRALREEVREAVGRDIDRASRQSPSEWERHLERDLYPLDPPLEMLRSRLRTLFVRRAWRRLRSMLNADELSALLTWARREAPRHSAVFGPNDQVLPLPA